MSGGHFDYEENSFCHSVFGWDIDIPRYIDGEKWEKQYASARKKVIVTNPLHDAELSEMLFDMLYIVHQCDFWCSADTGEDTYRKYTKWFKDKWLKGDRVERMQEYVDLIFDEAKRKAEVVCGLRTEED